MTQASSDLVAGRVARDKVRPVEELATIAEDARQQGRTVALCHGVFDLVHLGHVRHIEAARREGDLLIVTITADRFVNKGPGRPIFPEAMRAEMLAALEYVDWVGINHGASAEPLLDLIKPDVYVKGSDYENPDEDITGKINSEREVVERHGGRIVFTKDITFSSSNLINTYLDVYDPPLRDFLDRLRSEGGGETILDVIERVKDFRVLLVGDAIIDEYLYVRALGKAAKESMIATHYEDREVFAGGVFAAANHVANFCAHVEIITSLGGDDSREGLIRDSLKPNVTMYPVLVEGRPTTRKVRFLEKTYAPRKLFEVYFMDDSPMGGAHVDAVNDLIVERAKEADLVIVTDFGHGLIGPSTIQALIDNSRFLAINVQTNSGNQGYNLVTKYPRADFVCIDAPEARLAVADKVSDITAITGEILPRRVHTDKVIVTHGARGCYAYAKGEGVTRVPAFTKQVVDTVGAGDAFFTVSAPMLAAGATIEQAAFIGNAAGAMKVGIVGHRNSVEKIPLMKFVTTLLK
jgi:rfaE bifunctional protein kinase chain/domain/rfaE bifunctional protein nucleotidyltransferase chain/domain